MIPFLQALPVGPPIGLLLDRLLGEPPSAVHPIVWLGDGLNKLEERTYSDARKAGLLHLGLALGSGALMGRLLTRTLGQTSATAVSVAVASSGKMLGQSANQIGDQLMAGDLEGARASLPTLVGRDASNLNPHEVARAVIESVAENTVDAVTATLFFGFVGGPTAVICHRICNTLDAMVGHRTPHYENFGWASARLDDVLAAVPARLTVMALMLARPTKVRSILHTVRRDAWRHPSPNGGLVEAGFAVALDLRLGGENSYEGIIEDRGTLGTGNEPEPADIIRAVRLSNQVAVLFGAIPIIASAAFRLFRPASRLFRPASRLFKPPPRLFKPPPRLFKPCILTHSHLRSSS